MSTPAIRGQISVTTGHIDDAESMRLVCETLAAIHGADYHFGLTSWQDQTQLTAPRGRQRFLFIVQAQGAHVLLTPGQHVRGIPPKAPISASKSIGPLSPLL